MDDSADVVQKVLAAAAEDNGELELPLKPERVQAMRAALIERRQLVVAPPPSPRASCRLPLASLLPRTCLGGPTAVVQVAGAGCVGVGRGAWGARSQSLHEGQRGGRWMKASCPASLLT